MNLLREQASADLILIFEFILWFLEIIQNKRDPVANFMSSWKYYHGLTKEMRLLLEIPPIDGNEKTPDFIPEMEKFLKDPWTYLNPWPYSHSAYLFTVNPQLIFFGHPRFVIIRRFKIILYL